VWPFSSASTSNLHVDAHQLAGAFALIPIARLEWLQPAALPEPDPQQHRRDRRERHPQQLADFRRGHAHPPQGGDRAALVAAGAPRADPLIGLAMVVVILEITWDSWSVVSSTEPGEIDQAHAP
jgi:hypothetical protein